MREIENERKDKEKEEERKGVKRGRRVVGGKDKGEKERKIMM